MTTCEAEVLRMGREAQHFRLGTALADRLELGASGVGMGEKLGHRARIIDGH